MSSAETNEDEFGFESIFPESTEKRMQLEALKGHELYTQTEFSTVLNVLNLLYTSNRGCPSLELLAARTDLDPKKIKLIIKSTGFKDALESRGMRPAHVYSEIFKTDYEVPDTLTTQQVLALSIITDPSSTKSFGARLRTASISMATWRNWMAQPAFAEAANTIAENMLHENMAVVHTSLTGKASQGDVQAMRLFYELSGRHDPQKQQMIDFTRVVGLLLEAVTRHITDPDVIRALSTDFEQVLSGETLEPMTANQAPVVHQITDKERNGNR